jgi:hypothetical protein
MVPTPTDQVFPFASVVLMSFDNAAHDSPRLDPPTSDSQVPLQSYRVRVGLAECTVLCHTQREAVQLARVKIAQQLPQVRSLMFNILDREFRVDPAGTEPALSQDKRSPQEPA